MLKELSKAFKSGTLNYFWDKTFNLFGELTEEKIVSVQRRLDKIIKEIEAEPLAMTQYFCKYFRINYQLIIKLLIIN